jgi:hypothetical protein
LKRKCKKRKKLGAREKNEYCGLRLSGCEDITFFFSFLFFFFFFLFARVFFFLFVCSFVFFFFVCYIHTLRHHTENDKVKKSPSPDPKSTQQSTLHNHKDAKRDERGPKTDHPTSQESPSTKYDANQSLETLLKTPSFVTDFTGYLTEAGFVDAIYCWNELQNYKTLQKGICLLSCHAPLKLILVGYLPSYARGIYYKYFVSQASRVGVDGLTVRDIAVKLTAPDVSIFSKAEKQVLVFLEKQWLPNFFSNRDPKHVSFGKYSFIQSQIY